MSETAQLPVIVIGAGPVGLAAAAHLVERGLTPLVLERGAQVGASIRVWAHVGLFSPWEYNIDTASKRLLERVHSEIAAEDRRSMTATSPSDFPVELRDWLIGFTHVLRHALHAQD